MRNMLQRNEICGKIQTASKQIINIKKLLKDGDDIYMLQTFMQSSLLLFRMRMQRKGVDRRESKE